MGSNFTQLPLLADVSVRGRSGCHVTSLKYPAMRVS